MFVADGISSVGGNLTDETVERYGQLGGSLASKLDSLYEQVALKKTQDSRNHYSIDTKEVEKIVDDLMPENLFAVIPGRAFQAYPDFKIQPILSNCKSKKFKSKIESLCQILDRDRKVTQIRRPVPLKKR